MKTLTSILILFSVSQLAFAQSWGTTYPLVVGGYDVQYIPELNTTYGSGSGNVITLSHDTVTSSIPGPSVNKFRYFFGTLYAATEGFNSFQYLDLTWNAVPNVSLNGRSFDLDTLGANILILGEATEPFPGHVMEYDGNHVSTIPGLDVYWPSEFCATYGGKKYIAYTSPDFEAHLLVWDGVTSHTAQVPDNFGIANVFVSNSKLYATLFFLGSYELWEYDGSVWQFVLQFPEGFNCQGAFNDNDEAVYFFGSRLYKCVLPQMTLIEIENPVTNTIYAMTKDTKTDTFYISSNFIFWWDGKMPVATGITPHPLIPAMFKFDMSTKTLIVDYDGAWMVFNPLGQIVVQGNGKTTENLGGLPAGAYIISAKETRWIKNKFLITR